VAASAEAETDCDCDCDCEPVGVAVAAVALGSVDIARLAKTTNTTAKMHAVRRGAARASTISRPSKSPAALSAKLLRMSPDRWAKWADDARKSVMHTPRHIRRCLLSPPMTIPSVVRIWKYGGLDSLPIAPF
jgi:hypothetical protein